MKADESAGSSEGGETSFESANSAATSEESHISAELQNLDWTKDVDRVMCTDLNDNNQGNGLNEVLKSNDLYWIQGRDTRCKSRYPSSLFTEDFTIGELVGVCCR